MLAIHYSPFQLISGFCRRIHCFLAVVSLFIAGLAATCEDQSEGEQGYDGFKITFQKISFNEQSI